MDISTSSAATKRPRPYVKFGEPLSEALKRSGIQRKNLATSLGVDVTMISHYCRGENVPSRVMFQKILLHLRPSQRRSLMELYHVFDLPEQSLTMFQTPHEELLEYIEELITAGCTFQATHTASTALQETLDPQLKQSLQDLMFELHMRLGKYGNAQIHASSVERDALHAGADRSIALLRANCMKLIAFRATAVFQEAVKCLAKVSQLHEGNREKFDQTLTHAGSYLDVIRRERILTLLGGTPPGDRANVARSGIKQLVQWAEHAASVHGKYLLLEAAGRCHIALNDPGGAEDILEEISPSDGSFRALFERCQILQGRCHLLRRETEQARACFERASSHAEDLDNRHHAHIAQKCLQRSCLASI